jgi:hypothetical protein
VAFRIPAKDGGPGGSVLTREPVANRLTGSRASASQGPVTHRNRRPCGQNRDPAHPVGHCHSLVGPSPREPEALRHLLEADGGCFRPCGRRSGAPFRKDIVTGVGAKQILARRPVRYPRSSCSSRRGRKRSARSSSNDPAGRGILASPYRTHSTDASSAGRGAEAGFGVVNSAAGVGSRGGTVESPWAFVPATQASRAGIEDFQSRVQFCAD